jgi:hypothetical protein
MSGMDPASDRGAGLQALRSSGNCYARPRLC